MRTKMRWIGLVLAGLLMVGAGHSGAAPEPAPVLKLEEKADLFAAGKWTVNPFVAYSVSEIGAFNGDFAGGLALGYAVTKNLTLEAWALGNEYESAPVVDTVDQAGAYLKFYAPIKESGFAPYALLGYGYGQHTQAHNMEMGPGIEYRFKLTGKLGGTVFADAVWVQNFGLQDPVTYARVKIRGGVGLSF